MTTITNIFHALHTHNGILYECTFFSSDTDRMVHSPSPAFRAAFMYGQGLSIFLYSPTSFTRPSPVPSLLPTSKWSKVVWARLTLGCKWANWVKQDEEKTGPRSPEREKQSKLGLPKVKAKPKMGLNPSRRRGASRTKLHQRQSVRERAKHSREKQPKKTGQYNNITAETGHVGQTWWCDSSTLQCVW